MIATYLSRWVSGDASITQSFLASTTLLALWSVTALFLLSYIGPLFVMSHFVILVNTSRGTKFLARFCNFILLFAGIVMIILVTSGEVSWLTYLSKGIHSSLR